MDIVDEEKKDSLSNGGFETIEEGVTLAAPRAGGPTAMSLVSQQYDTTGKGYLDPTEKAMRRMDSQNLGFLTPDKVYKIMEQLQEEHTRSHELIRELHEQTNKALSLKKAVYVLLGFSVLLALSNIGTSFAAASLAKDTSIQGTDMIAIDTNTRVATTPKFITVEMTPVEESRRKLRNLEELTAQVCADIDPAVEVCMSQPEIKLTDAENMYHILDGGASEVILNCAGQVTRVKGGIDFPRSPKPEWKETMKMFPGENLVYNAEQTMQAAASLHSSIAAMPAGGTCVQEFRFAVYCFDDEDEVNIEEKYSCIPFISFSPNELCPWVQTSPELCKQPEAVGS